MNTPIASETGNKPVKMKIAIWDCETDPFKFGRVPVPFCWGFKTAEKYIKYWGDDCIKVFAEMLEDFSNRGEDYLILAHNGGKFDFLFIIEHLSGAIRIVNGRILEASMFGHKLRDSYGILPIPLKLSGGKKEIDYRLMERDVRENHKDEILEYLEADCNSLFDMVVAFYDMFGDALTIGGAAMREFKKFHKFDQGGESFDAHFRKFYYGGRCQCFETGIIDANIKWFDLNSAYPKAMRDEKHPVSIGHSVSNKISERTNFVCWSGDNFNAVPVRTKSGLDFTTKSGKYFTTIHEFIAGLETGTIAPKKIHHAIDFHKSMNFFEYVDFYYNKRLATDDVFLKIFYKLMLNTPYGKFAQNPERFCDCLILPWGEIAPVGYIMEYRHDQYAIWSIPTERKTYFNVATAASITGATRAMLLRGLAHSTRPIYCDTDSIACTDFDGYQHAKELGAWKLETEGTQIAIGGKKLYALVNDGECVKKASKGTNLHPLAIFAIARGDTVESRNDAPTFKLGAPVSYLKDGEIKYDKFYTHGFIERNIKSTAII